VIVRPGAGAAAVCAVGAVLAAGVGCGSAHPRAGAPPPRQAPPSPARARRISGPACAGVAAATLATVAARVYREAQAGSNVAEARSRVERSSVLSDAVVRGDGTAAAAALRTLMAGQIIRIEVQEAGRVLARAGQSPALAPVVGVLRGPTGAPVGQYRLSVENEASFVGLLQGITGSQVLLRGTRGVLRSTPGFPPGAPPRGPLRTGGRSAYAVSIPVQTFRGQQAQVTLLTAPPQRCAGGRDQVSAATLGQVARRIYDEEVMSKRVHGVQARIASFQPLRKAVATHDPVAARQAIVALFRSHIHVVRVRVSTPGGGLLVDVGGPEVLAPVSGPLRDRTGRTLGTLVFALQDDAGYVKLVKRFTGAEVILRSGGRPITSTLAPGAGTAPTLVRPRGRGPNRRAFSFTGTAFPAGDLRISVLVRGA